MVYANAGIPLIGPVIALGWLSIVPVVFLETIIAMILLRWRFVFALRWVSSANAITVLLGIPVAWFLTAILSTFVGGGGWGDGSIIGVLRSPAWLGPGYVQDLAWAVPLGMIVLCVPLYLMSWWVEFAFLRRVARASSDNTESLLWAYAWKANFASYTLLVILLLLHLANLP
jgi:hypothetical protein